MFKSIIEDKMKNRIDYLVEFLSSACDAYYSGSPIIDDHEYDKLFDELEDLEKKTGYILADSPTKNVGSIKNISNKVTHKYPALSLDKTKDIDKFISSFDVYHDNNDMVTLMWKLDGATAQLTYENGNLLKAATRGDGYVGQDITKIAPYIAGIPSKVSDLSEFTVRGEVVISYTDFEAINYEIDVESRYKNPRNLASGSLTLLDIDEVKNRKLQFYAFELVDHPNLKYFTSFNSRLNRLKSEGFRVVDHLLCSVHESSDNLSLRDGIDKFNTSLSEFKIPVDGLVGAFDNTSFTDELKGTSHHPNILKGYAFKWSDEEVETILRDIEWSPSRTRTLTPVAVFDPVEIDGTTVTRASLHNFSILESLQLRIGDKISVYKANKIIPQIASNLTPKGRYTDDEINEMVGRCAYCHSKGTLVTNLDSGISYVLCENPNCNANIIYKLDHFCSRDALDIQGLGESVITKFVELGFLNDFIDIFKLDRFKDQIIELDGWGLKSWENLWNSIQSSQNTTMSKLLVGLGIQGIGLKQAKILEDAFQGDIEAFINSKDFEFETLDNFGSKSSDIIRFWLNNGMNILELRQLINYLTLESPVRSNLSNSLNDLSFVITGSLKLFKNRNELVTLIEDNGGSVKSSVTSSTNYLINNDTTSRSSKNLKAKELGITIINEQQLLEMLF